MIIDQRQRGHVYYGTLGLTIWRGRGSVFTVGSPPVPVAELTRRHVGRMMK